MLSRLVLGFLFVLQLNPVLPLTNDTQITVTNGETVPCSCKVYDRKSDILRQLLNQETIIRMALEKKVHNIVKDVEKLKERMESNNENSLLTKYVKQTSVGFTVAVTSSSHSWQGDILVFPHVITNKGNSYRTSTGKFTAPRTGTYVFFVAVVSYQRKSLFLDIVHNDADKVGTMSYGDIYQTGTNKVVLELSQGDTVWVRRYSGQGYYTESVPITTFSGFHL